MYDQDEVRETIEGLKDLVIKLGGPDPARLAPREVQNAVDRIREAAFWLAEELKKYPQETP